MQTQILTRYWTKPKKKRQNLFLTMKETVKLIIRYKEYVCSCTCHCIGHQDISSGTNRLSKLIELEKFNQMTMKLDTNTDLISRKRN